MEDNHYDLFSSALDAGPALRVPEEYRRDQLSEGRVIAHPPQVDGCIASGQGHAAVVRVSRHSARKAEMGNGMSSRDYVLGLRNWPPCLFCFSVPGIDYAMRAGRISWRRSVLWLDGAGCNEAYHGMRNIVHARTVSFTFSQGIDPLLFFGGATLGCMGTYLRPSHPFLRLPLFFFPFLFRV